MNFKIGLESGDENRSIAWMLGHPGCFAYGPDANTAVEAIQTAIRDYTSWVADHGGEWLANEDVQYQLVEKWNVYFVNENYERVQEGYAVNAWFLDDWRPLQEIEVERGRKLLEWSRKDLLETVRGVDQNLLERLHPGERWPISGILKHVANAEWWYMDRLDLGFPRSLLHEDGYERLEKVRGFFLELLPSLVGARRVAGTDAEFWSPRKLLRRAVWHERDHTFHIKKLLELAH
jgi:hypothetical protein